MHSPGMRAPPVSHDSGANSENGSSQRGVKGKKGTGRRGRRSPGKSGSPVGAGESPSPQPEVTSSSGAPLPVMGETPPSRSWSVPGNVSNKVDHHVWMLAPRGLQQTSFQFAWVSIIGSMAKNLWFDFMPCFNMYICMGAVQLR